jgi:hypothetical protein
MNAAPGREYVQARIATRKPELRDVLLLACVG